MVRALSYADNHPTATRRHLAARARPRRGGGAGHRSAKVKGATPSSLGLLATTRRARSTHGIACRQDDAERKATEAEKRDSERLVKGLFGHFAPTLDTEDCQCRRIAIPLGLLSFVGIGFGSRRALRLRRPVRSRQQTPNTGWWPVETPSGGAALMHLVLSVGCG